MPASVKFDFLIDFELKIGESPVWDDARKVLWFVDIPCPAIFCVDPVTRSVGKFAMPADVGSVSLASDSRLIVALRTGIHLFDPGTGDLEFLIHPEPDRTMNRLNDGKVGPDGCFWVGSMHDAWPRKPSGALYRITPSGACERVLDGLKVSNGLAWSPDGRVMYHSDSRGAIVRAFDFDAARGLISNERMLLSLTEEQGLPDGAAVDSEGFYWSAGVTAGKLNKISPEGALVEVIELPVSAPTMPCFGGVDGRTLFVTSLSAPGSSATKSGGTLLSFAVGTSGAPIHRFGEIGAPVFV